MPGGKNKGSKFFSLSQSHTRKHTHTLSLYL